MKEKIFIRRQSTGTYDIFTNFKVEQYGILHNKIKEAEGVEFCFAEGEYRIYVSWNMLFDDKIVLENIIKIIKEYVRNKIKE